MLTGIVEGFYGRSWSWQERHVTADFLHRVGLNAYLYCPKSDGYLRHSWQQDWPAADWEALSQHAQHCLALGLHWGVGLSPYALYRHYGSPERERLQRKVETLNGLGGDVLALLFDDMPGDCPDLAARQSEIIADVARWSTAAQLLVCPTYYSFDPVLERFFGVMPEGYYRQLGAALDDSISVMWTGQKVCSNSITAVDVRAAQEAFGRAVCLWDNYPVNDGEKGSKYINIAPLSNRDSIVESELVGHLLNPMNQPCLSQYPVATLASLHNPGSAGWMLEDFYTPQLATYLRENQALLQEQGLAAMSDRERQRLLSDCAAMDDPAAVELIDWLQGGYAFDPACLTG